ncbi:MAG: S41 family peptidase [Candidatus Aminicenantes bacterium]|nr:S41 family peptidase [Candidatus Aminicenantes bacterium]
MLRKRQARVLLVTAIVAAVLFFCLEKSVLPGGPQRGSSGRDFSPLATVIRYIKSDYLEEPDPKKTMEGAFQGLVNALDILSSYLDKPAVAKYTNPQKLQLKDIGAIIYKRYAAFPLVIGIVANSPAEKAGIKIGDYLSALDERSTLVWSLTEINLYLKDGAAVPVKLRLIRDNSTKEMMVIRSDIYPKTLTATPLSGTAGIVRIHHFYPSLVAEFKTSLLPRLKGQKAPLIIDLRDCHEGEMSEARAFLNLFLKTDKIGYLERKGGLKDYWACPEDSPLESLPVIVWVNQATMGPAELAAGVLKDLKKVKVIGLSTPGLTGKQDLFALGNGDALLLTTGVFCFNSGEKLWSKGVAPDVKLDLDKTDDKAYTEKTLGLLSGH